MTPAIPPPRSDAPRGEVDAWVLTGRISPRRVVRSAGVDGDGQPLNSYPLVHPIAGARPRTPWAVHLADATGRYRLLCVDLDAKGSSEAAAADATQFGELVSELGIEHLVCASGPTGGRHVWIGLRDALDAEAVRALAYLLKAWLPSLDVAPLTNPTSGCARPPGAPHRLGGNSQVIAGSVAVLTEPTVTTGQIHALMSRVADHVHAVEPATQPTRSRPVGVVDGMPFLPGTKRALSASCRGLLEATPTGDLSTVLWRVLCGAAAARWRFRDVLALADAPGLEHARTLRAGATRMPRPTRGPASPTAMLRRQWTRAVQAVAQLGPGQAIEGTDMFRMGRLQPLIEDDRIENISIVGFDGVWLDLADGSRVPGPPVADSDQELTDFLTFLASRSEISARPFSEAQPKLHLQLDDGSRLAATAWVSPRPLVLIRRHRLTEVSLQDLVDRQALSPLAASFLTAAVRARLSVVVAGAQGFGKTTMARALCGAFDPKESIATLESEFELGLHEMPDRHKIVYAWQSRPGSGERGPDGRQSGEFTLNEALHDSFRFTAGRTIVGEVRGPEAWLMVKAMESGSGSISTTRSVNARGAMRKLVTCAMEFGPQVTHELATRKLAETINLIVQLDMEVEELPDGTERRHRWVSEIVAISPGEKDLGYATTTVFDAHEGRVAVAHTLPDELRRLERHGFDLAGFLTEARSSGVIA